MTLQDLTTDFAGIHEQHAAAWSSFNSFLSLVLGLEAIPFLAVTSFDSTKNLSFADFSHVPAAIVVALAFSAVAGSLGYMMLVNMRLLILFYARALNGYRAMFIGQDAALQGVQSFLPLDARFPAPRERKGIMVLISVLVLPLNGLYAGLAVWNLFGNAYAALIAAVLLIAYLITWYRDATTQPVLSGVAPAVTPSPEGTSKPSGST